MLLFCCGGGWGAGGEGERSIITHKLEGSKEKKETIGGGVTRSSCAGQENKTLFVNLVYVLEKLVKVS